MKFSRLILTIDVHTAGEPVRVVAGGIPPIHGRTMAEKKKYFIDNFDNVRRVLMFEPRGHKDMYGVVLTEPTREDCDFGLIFLDSSGCHDMCIHGTIGVAKVLVETGLVQPREPITEIGLDTSAGFVKVMAKVEEGAVKEVTVRNVPSFVTHSDFKVNVPEVGFITIDLAFGGNFFAIVDANDLGVKVETQNIGKLVELGVKIREAVNQGIKVEHPLNKHIKDVKLVEICDEPKDPKATYRNAVIFGLGQLDRSPCGTGTSAKIATLYSKGLLKVGEQIISESIIGTHFKGKILSEAKVGKFKAVIPEITGQAYITGFHQFLIDPIDPVKEGFLI
jgi:proline racemase